MLSSEAKSSGLPKIPILPEPFVGRASTRLSGHCSEIACLLPGSVCPARALLSVSASWAEPTILLGDEEVTVEVWLALSWGNLLHSSFFQKTHHFGMQDVGPAALNRFVRARKLLKPPMTSCSPTCHHCSHLTRPDCSQLQRDAGQVKRMGEISLWGKSEVRGFTVGESSLISGRWNALPRCFFRGRSLGG